MTHQTIHKSIEEASKIIGKTWPLYSFVTSNPLSGYETKSFEEAVTHAEKLLNAQVLPDATLFKDALQQGNIHREVLVNMLKENQLLETPEFYLQQMTSQKSEAQLNTSNDLDRISAKWLAAFMDEGLAEWDMPHKDKGFYSAWRTLAIYDNELPKTSLSEIPKTSLEALENLLKGFSEEDITNIFTNHLAALPGWTGYINHRTETSTPWQQAYPITLQDYLAVRLWIAKKIEANILPKTDVAASTNAIAKLQYIWLKAWEKSWQNELEQLLDKQEISSKSTKSENQVPDAQLVFCIDTRSELIRRHVENSGNYETYGYAGFFGIAMDYESMEDGLTRKSCPPILNSAYHVSETAQKNHSEDVQSFKKKNEVKKFKTYFLKRMKNMLPSAFGFVEGSGVFYGLSLIARTIIPSYFYKLSTKNSTDFETICEPEMTKTCTHEHDKLDISLAEKVAIVKSGFDLMGWETFAPLVVFAGHGSHTANNPFGSSLDCGACAASPGRHNARMLAKLANTPDVRKALKEQHQIEIPENTVFIGAEHNTTTDEIVLFDSEVPKSHAGELKILKQNLEKAQQTATQERLHTEKNSVAFAHKKANDWGETRPEWGLAKNAGFVVGPRSLTKNNNLDGRCFLHSYNWEMDETGKALEGIMQGPMVVTQWINNHYYFSTVDNKIFGSGSKITHNVTGKFGVVQGNGGDLKMGLPLQSLMQSDNEMYHQPLRLSVVIQAPLQRVSNILLRNAHLKNLLDNEWIYLMVMNPEDKNNIYHYKKNMNWVSADMNLKTNKTSEKINKKDFAEVEM